MTSKCQALVQSHSNSRVSIDLGKSKIVIVTLFGGPVTAEILMIIWIKYRGNGTIETIAGA